jgi:predicted amidophosphoribosyltransferase
MSILNEKPCIACKEAIPTDDRFCMHCGAEQVAAAEVVAAPVAAPEVAVVVEPVAAPEVAVVVEPVAASVAGVVSAAPEVKAEEQQKPCIACKEAIPTDDRFCMHCGAVQVAAAPAVAASEPQVQATPAVEPLAVAAAIECVPVVPGANEFREVQLDGPPVATELSNDNSSSNAGPTLLVDISEPKPSLNHESERTPPEPFDKAEPAIIKPLIPLETASRQIPSYSEGVEIKGVEYASYKNGLNVLVRDSDESQNRPAIPRYLRNEPESHQVKEYKINCNICSAELPGYAHFCLICGAAQDREVFAIRSKGALEGEVTPVLPIDATPEMTIPEEVGRSKSESIISSPSISNDEVKWRASMATIRLNQERTRQDLIKLFTDKNWWKNTHR